MNKDRILTVEDDPEWIDNYQRWLDCPPDDIDVALTLKEAIERIRTNYYALVLLDLSLDPKDSKNRESIYVQEYLKKNSEGTQHIIISAYADEEDVRKSAFQYKAFDVFFKTEFEDPTRFITTVQNAIGEARKQRPDFGDIDYKKIVGKEDLRVFEQRMLITLKPKNGARGYLDFMKLFLKTISPMEFHSTRNRFSFTDHFIFGLCWSRGLGTAISICLTNINLDDDTKKEAITNWLGWDPGREWKKIVNNNIKGYIHFENSLKPDEFNLPQLR